jgi:hypothetical protein
MWNVKTKLIPVTIGATGTVSKFSEINRAMYWENMI